MITLDFETYYDKDYSLSKMTTEAYIRDPRFQIIGVSVKQDEQPALWYSYDNHQQYAELLSPLMGEIALAHHAAFDGAILNFVLGLKPKFWLDTLSMARPKHNMGVGGSLKALAEYYELGAKGTEVVLALGKRREDFTPADLHQYGEYCKNDVELTYQLFHKLKVGFPKSELKVIDLMLRMFTEPALRLDDNILAKYAADLHVKKLALLKSVESVCGQAEMMSNEKFALVLKGLGVEPPTKISARTGKQAWAFSKTDTEFKDLLEHDDPRVQVVVAARLGVKTTIEETRTERFRQIAARGTLPIMLNYYGAHTGRASGGDKVNLQNLSRGGALRRSVVAPEGYSLVTCDSSQIEARITAWLAGQHDLVQDFRDKADVYSKFATDVYGRPVDRKRKEIDENGKEFKPDEVPGFVGKTCILGLGFGTGAAKLRNTLKVAKERVLLDEAESQRIVGIYRNKYKAITRSWREIGDAILQSLHTGNYRSFGPGGILTTCPEGVRLPNGLHVRYPNLFFKENGFFYCSDRKQAGNFVKMKFGEPFEMKNFTYIYGPKVIENVVQALARIIVFDQMALIASRFPVKLTVHDEVVCLVPDAQVDECAKFMLEVMSTPPNWAKELPIAAETGVGKSYGDAK